jgi:hypothetical protein
MHHFKLFYADMKQTSLVKLGDIYSDDIVFCDPVHQVQGLANVMAYLESSVANVEECRFEYLDEVIGDGTAYIKWNMHYLHPSISNQVQTLRGVTHLHFDDKISYHEDIYDMGAMVYEHIPLMGFATKMVKRRMSKY